MNDNVSCEKSVSTGKMHTDDDVAKWSIVHFETDEEEDVESFNDLIPSSWITTTGTLCWYPMTEHQATIQKLVKQCAKANLEWNCFSIKTIEEDIGKYDQGMKMLVKFSKNPNATLYSDIEEKGKGKRLRKRIKYFDDNSDNENNNTKGRNIQLIPPLPKLANASNSAQASEPVKVNKMIKPSCVDKASSSSDNNVKKPVYVTHEINVSRERSKNKNYMECKGVKPLQETSFSMEMRKSAAITSDEILSSKEFSSSDKGYKLCSTIDPKCTSAKEGKESVTLESLADAISNLKAEMLSCKLILRKIDRNVESFLETETMMNKCTNENISTAAVYVLDEFPLTNLSDLEKMEQKLKKDKTFHSKVVDALHSGDMGQSLQKKVNSILRMVLDDKLASSFNWKGQRGTKLKLAKRRKTKIMIEAAAIEFPTINETTFGRKAGPWLAQATFRIKKYNSKKENAADDISEISGENEDDSSANENISADDDGSANENISDRS